MNNKVVFLSVYLFVSIQKHHVVKS